MKPAPFDYQAPGTLREAIAPLASNPEASVIAGGQSLMPVLAFRRRSRACWSICGGCPGSAILLSAMTRRRKNRPKGRPLPQPAGSDRRRWRGRSAASPPGQSMRARAGADHSEMCIAQRSLPVLVIKQGDAGEGEIALTPGIFSQGPAPAARPFRQVQLGDDLVQRRSVDSGPVKKSRARTCEIRPGRGG
jgi:FAD binding domain in molybdopterin dehydrogenase